MFSLSLREQFLVAAVLGALVTGAAVKHWRDARRETLIPVASGRVAAIAHGARTR